MNAADQVAKALEQTEKAQQKPARPSSNSARSRWASR